MTAPWVDSCGLMSLPDESPALPSFDTMTSYQIGGTPTGEPPAGPSIEKRASRLQVDHDFNFQLVVFEVYFPSSNLHMKK